MSVLQFPFFAPFRGSFLLPRRFCARRDLCCHQLAFLIFSFFALVGLFSVVFFFCDLLGLFLEDAHGSARVQKWWRHRVSHKRAPPDLWWQRGLPTAGDRAGLGCDLW